MKSLTKSQRVYVVVLAVVVMAFLIDALFLGGDGSVQQAGAEGVPLASLQAVPAGPVPSVVSATPKDGTKGLAEALRACDTLDIQSIREAFEPSESWQLILSPPPPVEEETPGHSTPQAKSAALLKAQSFAKSHNLVSIIRNSDGGTALIDDRVVEVGQTLAGFTLVRLTERAVFFEADGVRVELRLPNDGHSE